MPARGAHVVRVAGLVEEIRHVRVHGLPWRRQCRRVGAGAKSNGCGRWVRKAVRGVAVERGDNEGGRCWSSSSPLPNERRKIVWVGSGCAKGMGHPSGGGAVPMQMLGLATHYAAKGESNVGGDVHGPHF